MKTPLRLTQALAFPALALLLASLGIHCGGGSASSPHLTYPQTNIVAAVGLSIPPDRPALWGNAGPPYSITPDPPEGVTLDSATGTISGTPVAVSPATTYTVTAGIGSGTLSLPIQITVGPAGSVRYQVLNCLVQLQQHSEWCGIASCACILQYRGISEYQFELENYAQNITWAGEAAPFYWGDPLANRGCNGNFGPNGTETDVLTHFGVPCTGRYSALTYDEIKTEIGANRPFMIHSLWSSGDDDHNLVGIGWDERNGDQEVVFMNPMAGIVQMSYAWLCDGTESLDADEGSHSWDKTITLNQ